MAVFLFKSLYLLPLIFFVAANAFLEDVPLFRGFSVPIPTIVAGWKAEANPATYNGSWEVVSANSGVSAMHLVMQPPTNKILMFDATVFGPSQILLPFGVECRTFPCYSHAVSFNTDDASVRPLKVLTDPWCSAGGITVDGTVVNVGGWNDGERATRWLSSCTTCDWRDYIITLADRRWYATMQILPKGDFIIIGGRRAFTYEYLSKEGVATDKLYRLQFLRDTTDDVENNLYPFVFLSTDGNIFIFANNRSVLLNTKRNTIIREYPVMPGGSRSYPASGMSALLPIRLQQSNPDVIPAEVIVCGGALPEAGKVAEKFVLLDALTSCGRINITDPNAQWVMEDMPMPRVMSDMLILPTGDLLIINGAQQGVSGWGFAEKPALTPMLYKPNADAGSRFTVLKETNIPRMYHSTAAVLPDGKILVAGSNTNNGYNLTVTPGIGKYPTDMRVEKFWPPYLDPLLTDSRPQIVEETAPTNIKYGDNLQLDFTLGQDTLKEEELEVTLYYPPFTTHGFSMSQRLLMLAKTEVVTVGYWSYQVQALAPPSNVIAPSGYYLLFVVYRGVPSPGVWIHIQ